ncbi:hypothetical protein MJO28_007792 [Puccinia striiformis f. sp. tritici]|uniref:Uncharacterized protein n=1 Tax=Puccinia striiformis f. sp. tritici TaxID=168172 RepID=A0ACC0EGP4_9BASI|nr:hypothetical protein MJO28_007792 [Puccinia striiformis f. sp. tritici]
MPCTLVSRGFWAKDHYWGKVLRHVNGLMGVWMHDNQHNAGHACLVDTVPGSISGAQEHTSWVVYSRTWDAEEEQFVDKSIARIRKDNPEFPSRIPFIHMKTLLNTSHHSNLPHGSPVPNPSVCDSKLPLNQVEDLCPKDDPPYAEADPPAEAESPIARHKATWHSHLPPPTPPPSQSVDLKDGGAPTEDKSKTKEEATLALKKVATSGAKKAAPLRTKKAAAAPKKKATTAAKKKGLTSAPKTPATLASTAPTTFQPAPLTDADYDRMAARGAAYWSEHWAKGDSKKATLEPSQITVAKDIAPPPGEPTNVKSTARALGTRRLARTRRSDA